MIERIKASVKCRMTILSDKLRTKSRLLSLRLFYRLRIMDAQKTIIYIRKNGCSIARYGDGEFDILMQAHDLRFQKKSPELAQRLAETLANKNEKLLLCVPWSMNHLKYRNRKSKDFWIWWALHDDRQKKVVQKVRSLAGKRYRFGDAQITRPYIAMKTPKRADLIFPLLCGLWENRDVLIVEGRHTCLGVGNDLFAKAKTVRRVLAPATDAFDCYSEIVTAVKAHWEKGQLVILALGPTATVLASDLTDMGMQALDIGHLDVEYEWYLRKVNDRVALPGKFTNEVSDGDAVSDCDDPEYQRQIVAKVE